MDADAMMSEYATAKPERQRAIIQQLSDHAEDLIDGPERARGMHIHAFIAHLDPPADAAAVTAGLLEAVKLNKAAGRVSAGVAGFAAFEAHMLAERLIDMSREICAEAGIACPPSNSPDEDSDAGEDEDLEEPRGSFREKRMASRRAQNAFQVLLAANVDHAEAALRGLIAKLKRAHAKSAILVDGWDFKLDLPVALDGKVGTRPDLRTALVTGYADLSAAHTHFMPSRPEYWPWLHQRWLAAGGPACGIPVKVFYNNSGEEMDLNTGIEV
jgi:hypothetical protein